MRQFLAWAVSVWMAGQVVMRVQPVRADDLFALSDAFDDSQSITNWLRLNETEQWNADQLEVFDVSGLAAGWMTMIPFTSSWYENLRGVLVYKMVTGDFAMTTRVRTANRADTGAPGRLYSLAGILTRMPVDRTPATWVPGQENYIFLSHGAANASGTHQFEVKTTSNSVSVLDISAATSHETLIQTVRIGSHFILLRREPGAEWVVHRRYRRSDMPSALQVGFTTYTDWDTITAEGYWPGNVQGHNEQVITNGQPDLLAQFDYARYHRPVLPESLATNDLSNPAAVSDAELLMYLGGFGGWIGFATNGFAGAEVASTQVVQVVLSRRGGLMEAVTAQVAVVGGTASLDGDFRFATQSVAWADGDMLDKTLTLEVIPDAVAEGEETVMLAIDFVSGSAGIGLDNPVTVTIADDPFDAWRHAHFGDDAQTPEGALAGDYDGDRANNWAEYIAGTLPADSNSVFRVAELAASGDTISWPSVAGRRYAVQVSTNLLTGFEDHPGASNLLSTPLVNVFTNAAFTNQSPLWYRLRVWREDD